MRCATIARAGLTRRGEYIIRNAHGLTMDLRLGDLPRGVDGRVLKRDGRLTTIDVAKVVADAQETIAPVREKVAG